MGSEIATINADKMQRRSQTKLFVRAVIGLVQIKNSNDVAFSGEYGLMVGAYYNGPQFKCQPESGTR